MPDESSVLEPQTVDQEGNPPRFRITTAAGAWKAYEDAKLADRLNDARYASLRGIFDGMPPVSEKELEDQGLADMPNINLRQFQSKIEAYVSTWVDHDCGGEKQYEVRLYREAFPTDEAWKRACSDVTSCFNDAICMWEDPERYDAAPFLINRFAANTQQGIFGIGILHFEDPMDWRPCFIPTRRVIVPPGTLITMDNCQAMWIQKQYTPSRLYEYVRTPEKAKATKWNREAVLKLLYNKTAQKRLGTTTGFEEYAEWENRIRNNEWYLINDFTPIELIHCYFQEFSFEGEKDGISHYVVAKWGQADPEFLYEAGRQVKYWQQIVIPFTDTVGPEADWHGIKGFGDKIFDGCHFNNVMFNAVATAAIISQLPQFMAGDESDRQKLSQVVFTRLGILFPDIKLAELKINPTLDGSLATIDMSNAVLNQNSRIFPQNDRRGSEQPTATQVTFDRQDQATFTSLQINLYRVLAADRVGTEMYRRMVKSGYPKSWPGGRTADYFIRKMESKGWAPEQVRAVQWVRADRTGGSGNMGLDNWKADQTIAVASPGIGQHNARREKVAALHGWDRVDEFVPPMQEPPPDEQVTINLENTTFQNAQFIPAYPNQLHDLHSGIIPDGSLGENGHSAGRAITQRAAAQLQDAGLETSIEDAIKLANVLQMLLEHISQHLGFMAEVPANRDVIKPLMKTVNDLRQFTQQYSQAVQEAYQTQQPQGPQMDGETQAKLMKAQAEIQIMREKAVVELEIMKAEQQLRLMNMAQTAESRTALKEQQANIDAGLKTQDELIRQQREQLKTVQEVANTQARTEAEIEATRKKADATASAAKTKAKKNTKK